MTKKYLIEKYKRNIGFISGSEEDRLTRIPRLEGYKDALRDHNIAIKESHIVFSNEFFFEDGVEGMNLLLKRASNITAVFAASDEIDRKSTRLNSSHVAISYAVFCLKKKKSTT